MIERAHLWLALTMIEVVMLCGFAKNEHTTTDCSANDAKLKLPEQQKGWNKIAVYAETLL